MKKIIVVLFIILNTLLFLGIIDAYKSEDLSYMRMLRTQKPNYIVEWVALENNDDTVDSKAMHAFFKQLTQKHDILISFLLADGRLNEYNYYVASNEDIDKRFELVTDTPVNFNETDDYYYTNKKSDPNGIYFYLLNDALKLNIYPISHLGTMPSERVSFVADSQQTIDVCIDAFMEQFGEHSTRIGKVSSEPFIVEDAINSFLPMTIIIAIICISLLLMIYVQTQAKKIAIFKTVGMPPLKIGVKIFASLFLAVAAAVVVANILLFFLYVNTINSRTIPIIADVFRLTIFQLLGMVVVVVFGYLLLAFIPTYSMLKNSRLTQYLMNANFLIKVVVMLVIIPMVSVNIGTVLQNFSFINYSNSPEAASYQFVQKYEPGFEVDGYDLRTYYTEFGKEQNPDIIYKYDILFEYHNAYKLLNEAGAILCRENQPYGGVAEITVNENYLEEYPIKLVGGQVVDITEIDADVIYFMPETLFNSSNYAVASYQSMVKNNENYEMVVISDEQDIYVFSPLSYEFLQNPTVIALYKDDAFRIDTSIFWDVYSKNDINEILKDTWFYNKITTPTVKEFNSFSSGLLLDNIKYDLQLIILALVLTAVLIIQNEYLYLKVYSARIFARKLLGHNPFRICGRLIIEAGVALALAFIVCLIRQTEFKLLFLVALMEVLSYVVTVVLSWKTNAKFSNTGGG